MKHKQKIVKKTVRLIDPASPLDKEDILRGMKKLRARVLAEINQSIDYVRRMKRNRKRRTTQKRRRNKKTAPR